MYLDNNIVNILGKFLDEHGYIKLNQFLWGKNVKTDIITGNIILVDLLNSKMSKMKVVDKFLWIKKEPKVEIESITYNTLAEFKSNIIENEKTQLLFFKKQKEWKNRK